MMKDCWCTRIALQLFNVQECKGVKMLVMHQYLLSSGKIAAAAAAAAATSIAR
jgi:hypothetical protein